MPNITGDFQAVLQVSGGTVNRLLATLHQNAFTNPSLPSFPHSVKMRLGDTFVVDGVHGVVHAQIGVPRLELIDRATNRFTLKMGVRAWFQPDAGSAPFPGFINGTVRADYQLTDIDPKCPGWSPQRASAFLWVRVVKESVRFQGTAFEDSGPGGDIVAGGGTPPATDAENIAKVQRQVAELLARRFEATPHPFTEGFGRNVLRSLNVPGGVPAVALALSLSGGMPAGAIASIDNVILDEGDDIGLGVSIGYLLSLAKPLLDRIAQFRETFRVRVHVPIYGDVDADYDVTMDPPPPPTWEPHGSFAVVRVKIHGNATTASALPNATFDVDQAVMLEFDGGASTILASALQPVVTAHVNGAVGALLEALVRDEVRAMVEKITKDALGNIRSRLNEIPGKSRTLDKQLRTLDANAQARFTRASFQDEGVVLLGTVGLSARDAPVVRHEARSSINAHTALESWIPGGRVDLFEWTWSWAPSPQPGGTVSTDYRFLLRRPRGNMGQWGPTMSLERPLPGLDGFGRVCLRLRGVQVDPVTGALVRVDSSTVCQQYLLVVLAGAFTPERLMVRELPPVDTEVPFAQLTLASLDRASPEAEAANTLVVFPGDSWGDDTAAALRDGIKKSGRYDAGLGVLILFREGVLERLGTRPFHDLEKAVRALGVHVIVNEDVHGAWSRAFEVEGGGQKPAWALLGPQGNVTWRNEGLVSGRILSDVLDTHLASSSDLKPGLAVPEIDVHLRPGPVRPGLGDAARHCPPVPIALGGRSAKPSIVTFVQKADPSSLAHLGALQAEYGGGGADAPLVVALVDRATDSEAEALKKDAGVDFVVLPDPRGGLGDFLGVGHWPTTITVEGTGIVSEVGIGVKLRRG